MVSQGAGDLYNSHVHGRIVRAVQARTSNEDLARFEVIHLFVDGYRTSLTPTPDTDEIVLEVTTCDVMPEISGDLHPALKALVGRTFSWFWAGRNSQGYRDMFILSFGEDVLSGALQPYLAFLVEGATIGLHRIKEI